MKEKIIGRAKYFFDREAHTLYSLEDFQKTLFENPGDNFFIGKGRQEYVTTSFAILAYFLAKERGKEVAIQGHTNKCYKNYKSIFDLQEGSLERSEGNVFPASNRKTYRADVVFIDEAALSSRTVLESVYNAVMLAEQNVIAAVTLKNYVRGESNFRAANELLWALGEFINFRYIEAYGEDHDIFTEKDIRTYKSIVS